MDNNIIEDIIEYNEELYKKALKENDFSGSEQDRMGVDMDANN